jgi:HK97 family phage major capsid protein
MDEIKKLIDELVAEGKTLDEVVKAVMENDEVEAEKVDTDKLIADVDKSIVAYEASKKAKAVSAKKAEDKELEAKLDKLVEQKLRDMPAQEEKKEFVDYKYFNFASGKFEKGKELSESQKAFADLIKSIARKDDKSAESIEKDIVADWGQKAELMGVPQMKTPVYSDATTGSYLIPTEVAMDIMELAYGQSVMAGLLNRQAVVYESKIFPLIYGGDFAWISAQSSQLSDKTPTFDNPTVSMERFGGIYLSANELLRMKGQVLVSAFTAQAASKVAEFTDKYTTVGSTDGSGSDSLDGILFNSSCADLGNVAFTGISQDDLKSLINGLDGNVPLNRMVFMGNRKVRLAYGMLEDSAGNPIYRNFAETGQFRPYGLEFVENTQIPSTIDYDTDEPLTGSNDTVFAMDPTKILFAMDNLRIATSEHYKFDYDQFAWRFIARTGLQIASATGTAGIVAAKYELTN